MLRRWRGTSAESCLPRARSAARLRVSPDRRARDAHIERRRICPQNMIMDSGDFESILDRRGHYRRDLTFQQNQIAHHHRAVMGRLESCPATEGECGFYGHAVQRYAQISTRKAVSLDVGGYGRRTSERIIDFFPINFLRCSSAAHDNCSRQNNHASHSQCSFFLVQGVIDRQVPSPALNRLN